MALVLTAGTACVKRDVLVPLVCQPREGAPGIVHGIVRDAQTGAPLIGAKVEVWGDGSRSSTDLAGRYQIIKLRPGRYTLMVSYMGYGRGQQLVMIKPDQATTADIRVKPSELALSLTGPTSRPEPALELGAVVGTHCVSSYPVQWIWDEDLLTQRAVLVGVQAETEFGPLVAGLRAGAIGSYVQSVWMEDEPYNEFRSRLLGGDVRLSGCVRRPLVPDKLWAQVGLAMTLDYYQVWTFNERDMNSATVAEELNTGLRWKPSRGVSLGLDVDLNLTRQGYTNYFFSDTGPSPFLVFRVGTMSPSVVLSAHFPVGRRQLRPRRDGPKFL